MQEQNSHSNSEIAIATLQSMPEAVVVIDGQANVLFINDPACSLLKIKPYEILGKPFPYPPPDQLKISPPSTTWLTNVSSRKLRFRASTVLKNQEQYIGLLIVIQDENYEVAASEMLQTVLNELRIATTNIRGNTELLLVNAGDPLTDKQQQFVTAIKQQTKSIFELLEDVLNRTVKKKEQD